MYQKRKVIDLYTFEGKGAKSIKKEITSLSLNTIKKILKEYKSIKAAEGEEAANAFRVAKPVYHTPKRKKYKLTEHAMETIKAAVVTNEEKCKSNNRKQCVSKRKVWKGLVAEGEDISYSSVTKYARECSKLPASSKKCYILQYHPAGEECQFDWGEVKLKICHILLKLKMAIFCLPHSNQRRAFLFLKENTLAFMESHMLYFKNIGHIPKCMVYDNMRVAVKLFVGEEKEPTDALLEVSDFYGFTYRFCNKYSGNEKSYVENSVEVLRKEAFSEKDDFESIEEASQYLMEKCIYLDSHPKSTKYSNMQQLIEEDMNAMKVCTEDFGCYLRSNRKVNHLSLITVYHAFYSVPDKYVNSKLSVKEYSNKIEVYDKETKVAEHEKVPYEHYSIKLEHYLNTMSYKPGSVRHSIALQQAPIGIQNLFNEYFQDNPKEFIEMLLYFREKKKSYDDILDAYNTLKIKRVTHISFALIKSICFSDTSVKQILLPPNNEIAKQSELGLAKMTMLLSNTNRLVEGAK